MASLQRIFLRPAGSSRRLLAGVSRIANPTGPAPGSCAAAAAASKRMNSTTTTPPPPSSSSPQASAAPGSVPEGELDVGELQGAKFRIEPLRRAGEDVKTMRARLLRQSRGRGTLESELLLSTFAQAHLPSMTQAQMEQYDRFLDENDWDIYYWATQSEVENPSATATAQGSSSSNNPPPPQNPRPGEWAQTVGTFKPAYRPVPSRWRDSEIIALLRRHVRDRSAAGVLDGGKAEQGGGKAQKGSGGGMAFMPPLN